MSKQLTSKSKKLTKQHVAEKKLVERDLIISQIETILKKFPASLPPNENLENLTIISTPLDFKISHSKTFDEPEYLKNTELVRTLPSNYNDFFKQYLSLKHFLLVLTFGHTNPLLRENYGQFTEENIKLIDDWELENADFMDMIPYSLYGMPAPPKSQKSIDAYIYCLRKIVWVLTRLCAENPVMCLDNKKLKDWFWKIPTSNNSNFYKAVRIEPCLLQTDLGFEIVKTISFWNKEEAYALATAIKPTKKRSSDSFTQTNKLILTQILILIYCLHPKSSKLKDRELLEILKTNKYAPRSFTEESFRKIRETVFKKR